MKCWTEWITSRNQDHWEKYQQPQICRWYHSNGRKWRGTKEPLDESERGKLKRLSWNSTFKNTKTMASVPSLSSQIKGEKVEGVTDFIFLGSKITVDGDYSHEIKRCLLPGRKAVTDLDSMLKSRHITLLTKALYSQSCGFSHVQIWELDHKEGWATKFDAFELRCWRRHLRVLWAARSNQSTLKEIYPEYSLEDWCWK